jgi:hypothetical protein
MTKETFFAIRDELKDIIKDIQVVRKNNKNAQRKSMSYMSKNSGDWSRLWEESKELYPRKKGKIANDYTENFITTFHILYNQFRKRPAHLGSEEADLKYLINHGNRVAIKKVEEIKEKHQDA